MTTLRFHDGQANNLVDAQNPLPVKTPKRPVGLTTKQVSVTSSGAKLADENPSRISIKLTNGTGTSAVYVGPDSQVTTSNGDYLHSGIGSALVFTTTGAIYAIVASTTQTVTVAEESAL